MTSAVFHGNGSGFWNRNETYKQLGYDYFFHDKYFKINEKNSFQYGLHDKELFKQSIKYLEHLQQPFYVKYITVSNHFPYGKFHGDNDGFPFADTKDKTINGYFATANYQDTAVKEFFTYLKESGLYDHSIFVIYGDHYGISNKRNPDLAELLGKDPETWNDYDNAMLQRVPFMIHMPNVDIPGRTDESSDYINHTFGGEVDVLPTLLHLLGVDNQRYLQLGQDLLSPSRDQVVAFRNKNFITPDYTIIGSKTYITQGEQAGALVENPTPETEETLNMLHQKVNKQLAISDLLTTKDLLRFYGQDESSLAPINPEKYNYQKEQEERLKKIEKQKKQDSTSLYSKNDRRSTAKLYRTKSYRDYEKELPPQINPENEASSNNAPDQEE